MANRSNHYEAAFEAYLRTHRLAYVAVDETRRSLVADGSLKSLDFIVAPRHGPTWLIDVKGRRFPSGDQQQQYWKNWSTRDDLRSLARWQQHFGLAFSPLLVFAYHLVGSQSPLPPRLLYDFRGERYGFVAIRLDDYASHAHLISIRWDTVAMPTRLFRETATAFEDLLGDTPRAATAQR